MKPSSRIQGFVKYRLQTRVLSILFRFCIILLFVGKFCWVVLSHFIRKIIAYWPIVICLTEHSLSSCIGTSTSILILALFIWILFFYRFNFCMSASVRKYIIYTILILIIEHWSNCGDDGFFLLFLLCVLYFFIFFICFVFSFSFYRIFHLFKRICLF